VIGHAERRLHDPSDATGRPQRQAGAPVQVWLHKQSDLDGERGRKAPLPLSPLTVDKEGEIRATPVTGESHTAVVDNSDYGRLPDWSARRVDDEGAGVRGMATYEIERHFPDGSGAGRHKCR
jgi:hypothetical protein